MLSGSLPFGVRTFLFEKAIAQFASMQGSNILTKNVQQ
jgi:hypothetical protein